MKALFGIRLFVLASVLIWIGRITGAFDLVISGVEPLVGMLGLPDEAAPAFLYGFFRRAFASRGGPRKSRYSVKVKTPSWFASASG